MTPISTLGEFGLIERIKNKFKTTHNQVIKGIGDDAAVVPIGNGLVQVYTTDLLAEGVHFDLSYAPLRHLGYKAVAVNLSDIFAMNAVPFGITVSIAFSNRFTVEAIDELYEGIKLACERYHVDLLGGDTTSSRQGLVISVTAFGQAKEEEIVYRSGAQPNDLICVSGDAGAAYAGLLVLEREKNSFVNNPELQPDLSDYDYVVARQLKPEPRGDIIQELREMGVRPSAMIDVSDGIASELHHICHQSKVGALIYANKLNLDYQTLKVAEEFQIGATTFALNGGEDYELMFTLPLKDYDKVKSSGNFHIIGKITPDEKQIQILLDTGGIADVEAQGWDHFRGENG